MRLARIKALGEQNDGGMRFGLQNQIEAPRVVHDGLQTANAFEFDFVVRLPFLLAALQQLHNGVDAVFAELADPADWVAGEGDAQRFEALVDLVRTVLFGVLQVRDVVEGFLVAGFGAVVERRVAWEKDFF